jgi:hypothetical protein
MAIFNSYASLPECNFAMMIPTGVPQCVFFGGWVETSEAEAIALQPAGSAPLLSA